MRKKIYIACVCTLLTVLPSSWLHAESASKYINFGVSIQEFGYKELDSKGVLLDREDGFLPGVAVELGKKWQAVSASLRFALFDGIADYDGQTQTGIPLSTDTDERIATFEGLLRFMLTSHKQNRASFIAGIGFREWRRNIQASKISSSLYEKYRWKYLALGYEAKIWQDNQILLGIDVRWLRPVQPEMSVDILGYDEAKLKLGSRNSFFVSFPIRPLRGKGKMWTISPYWESWRLGRSADERLTVNGIPTATTVHEPRSRTSNLGLSLSATF